MGDAILRSHVVLAARAPACTPSPCSRPRADVSPGTTAQASVYLGTASSFAAQHTQTHIASAHTHASRRHARSPPYAQKNSAAPLLQRRSQGGELLRATVPHSQTQTLATVRPGLRQRQRRRPRRASLTHCRSSSQDQGNATLEDGLQILELPCLPFVATEVFVPGSTKTLHLYEARYLALLDEAMSKAECLFAHIVLEPVKDGGGVINDDGSASFVASYCCLAHIERVRRLQIGALITVRGVGRLRLLGLSQLEPFLRGSVTVMRDAAVGEAEEVERAVDGLKQVVNDVQQLQIRLRSAPESPLQTPLEEAMQWAEHEAAGQSSLPKLAQPFVPSRSELLPFASLQPVTGASPAELHTLLQKRLAAMETLDTSKRLHMCQSYADQTRAALAAKVALQSLSL